MHGEEYDYMGDEGYRLMGAAFEVYQEQGAELSEEIYQESLEIELELREIPFVSKAQLAVFYRNRMLRAKYIPDLIAYNEIIVELKAVKALLP